MKFKIGDTVRVLPNKMIGKVTDISEWFVILDSNQARPYMPQQLELVLKRYVLLNDYNLILDSKNEKELRVVHYDDGDVLKVVVDNWYYPLEKLNYKNSDNILDFVDVGDLVEINNMSGIYYVDSIITDEGLRVFTCDQKYGYWFDFNETEVKAIYKRQTNGDYKRYEVKE